MILVHATGRLLYKPKINKPYDNQPTHVDFSIVCSDPHYPNKPTTIKCRAYNNLAEFIHRELKHKGEYVEISGKIREFKVLRGGRWRMMQRIIIDDILFLEYALRRAHVGSALPDESQKRD